MPKDFKLRSQRQDEKKSFLFTGRHEFLVYVLGSSAISCLLHEMANPPMAGKRPYVPPCLEEGVV